MASIVLFGADGPQTYDLGDQVATLGRSRASTIQVDDKAASRKHCLVKPTPDDGYKLVDLGSANGTYVNGQRTREHQMAPEDRIKIGKTVLVFKA